MRGIFVGGDVELALEKFSAVEKVLASGDFYGRVFRLQIEQEHLGLRPALFDVDQKPAVIVGNCEVGNELRISFVFEDKRIFGGVGAELMIEGFDVVNLFASGDIALMRMARVVEARVIFEPGEAGKTRAIDGVRQQAAGCGFHDA